MSEELALLWTSPHMDLENHHQEQPTHEWIPNAIYGHSQLFKGCPKLLPYHENPRTLSSPFFKVTHREESIKEKRVKSARQESSGREGRCSLSRRLWSYCRPCHSYCQTGWWAQKENGLQSGLGGREQNFKENIANTPPHPYRLPHLKSC